jgi:CHAT domain-containing protein/tetratricopeptide (TPR) repeat protein
VAAVLAQGAGGAPPSAAAGAEGLSRAEREALQPARAALAARAWAAAESLAASARRGFAIASGDSTVAVAEAIGLELEALRGARRTTEPRARPLGEQALAILERRPMPDHRVARAAARLGWFLLAQGGQAEAESLFTRAVALERGARRPDARATAEATGGLAEALRVRRRFAQAESVMVAALDLASGLAPRDTALEVQLHGSRGNLFAETGRHEQARGELERAEALAMAQAPPDSATIARLSRDLGRVAMLTGDLPGARHKLARAVDLQQRALGPEHPELAATLYLASFAAAEAGDFIAARRDAERSVAIRERAFGPDHPFVAFSLIRLAGAARDLGDPEGALDILERAVAIYRAKPAASPGDLATALSNLGQVHLILGDGGRARACYREVIEIRERIFGAGRGAGVFVGVRLGEAMLLEGNAAAAEAHLDSVLARPGTLPSQRAEALQVLGEAAWRCGRTEKAHRCMTQAYALSDSLEGGDSPHTLEALGMLAALDRALGRRAEALARAERVESASREVLRSTALALSETEALQFARVRASGLGVLLALATDSVGVPETARWTIHDAVVRSRLLVLDQRAEEDRTLRSAGPDLRPLVEELEGARAELARVAVAALRAGVSGSEAIGRARERRDRAERELGASSVRFATDLRRMGAGLDPVAASLVPTEALVSYVRYRPPAADAARPFFGADTSGWRYAACIARPGRAPAIIPLPPASRLDPLVRRWSAAAATLPAADGARAAERRCAALGEVVRRAVWDPLLTTISGADRVYVVPDGVLHLVNFAALPARGGGYLVEGAPLIHRCTAERDLLPGADEQGHGGGLLAIGAPDFDRAAADAPSAPLLAVAATEPAPMRSLRDSLRIHFGSLPATAREIEELAALWRSEPHAAPAADHEAVLLTGGSASEAAFKRLAPGRRVLHLATHGFALRGGSTPRARPGERGVGGIASGEAGAAASGRGAPVLPGLAFAGANRPAEARDGADDGFLTAEEVTSLDLSGVEWAVLSACETGLSEPSAVEAVQGLHRAFRRAGVRTLIMSLWAVDDEATREWMGALYQARLRSGLSSAAAVQAACRATLRARRARGASTHPFGWAAFVAAGDPR